ncbi:MAG: hypothetical protein I3J02_09990 [Prevotella sp.]|nr:hypothetical protein [Prevotella sp.]
MRKILLQLAMVTLSTAVYADETYDYLAFQTTDGTEQTVSVDQLKIIFVDSKLVVTNASTNQSYSLSDLSKMYFTNTPVTGISDVEIADDNTSVEVFNTSGISMGTFADLSAARASLSKGIYIVKSSVKTYKIAVK